MGRHKKYTTIEEQRKAKAERMRKYREKLKSLVIPTESKPKKNIAKQEECTPIEKNESQYCNTLEKLKSEDLYKTVYLNKKTPDVGYYTDYGTHTCIWCGIVLSPYPCKKVCSFCEQFSCKDEAEEGRALIEQVKWMRLSCYTENEVERWKEQELEKLHEKYRRKIHEEQVQ